MSGIYVPYPSSYSHLNESRNERKVENVGEQLGHRDGRNLNSRDAHQRKGELMSHFSTYLPESDANIYLRCEHKAVEG